MATQALNGSGNVSYTNQTGKNIRLIINYININAATQNVTFSWGNNGQYVVSGLNFSFGKNLAFSRLENTSTSRVRSISGTGANSSSADIRQSPSSKNLVAVDFSDTSSGTSPNRPLGVPMEYMLSPSQTFNISGGVGSVGAYNILTITEN
jgi:hypothetical protein